MTISIIISIVSLIIAVASMSINYWLWRKINRPVVTARISSKETNSPAINLLIENTGNMPAKNIKIISNRKDVLSCLNGEKIPNDVNEVLFKDTIIPVLANGKVATTGFWAFGAKEFKENSDRWRSGAVLPIIIEYYNFEGRKFIEKSELRFAPDNAFAFYSWS